MRSELLFAVDKSRAGGAVLEPDAVKAIVERIAGRLKLGIPIRLHASEAALFEAVPEIGRQAEKDNADGQVSAVYFRGKVHVVSSWYAMKADQWNWCWKRIAGTRHRQIIYPSLCQEELAGRTE